MAFNSLSFLAFLFAVYCAFWLVPNSARIGLLLAASACFFTWASPASAGLLLACSILNFFAALRLERLASHPRRQHWLLATLVTVQVAALVVFKYLPLRMLAAAVGKLAVTGRWDIAEIAFPVGFSYYTFQGIGYIVDVAWGRPAERNLPRFLLFMSFFPKVLVGPIERGYSLLPQIASLPQTKFCYNEFRTALLRFGWGLFKKVVVADRLALYVNEVFDHPGAYPGKVTAIAMVFFALQLYADFSGYTDMALGVGQLFNLRLTQNFEHPFAARNIQQFWRRWHISFSSWISVFIFTPLRMACRRWKYPGLVFSIFVTFVIVGVWHGNGTTFALFGLLHSTYMTVSILTLKNREALWTRMGLLGRWWFEALRILTTFGLVVVSMVFFRAPTPADAWKIFGALAKSGASNIGALHIELAMIGMMFLGERFLHTPDQMGAILRRPLPVRWGIYLTLMLLVLCFGVFRTPSQFIYFRF